MFKIIAFSYLAIASSISLLSAQPHVLPKAGTGSCLAGSKYTINSIADLKTHVADLECIFAGAVAPDAIGLGFNYGTVLLGDNSVGIQPFAASVYQGDYVVETTCQQRTVHLGTLKVAGMSVGTAPWMIAPFTEATIPGEAPIDPTINNILMDFRQNVQDICPIEDPVAMLNSKGFLPFRSPVVPVNCFVDIARVVGRDASDGGIILLAKGMNNDPALGWQTSLFYALKNFDPAVKPKFAVGTPLIVPATFQYLHNGFIGTVTRFGGAGLIPFMTNMKRSILTAMASNPLVAAFAVKSGGFNPIASTPGIPFADQLIFNELAQHSLLGGLVADRMLKNVEAELVQENTAAGSAPFLLDLMSDQVDNSLVEGIFNHEFYQLLRGMMTEELGPGSFDEAIASNLRTSE